jgi:DNA-binding transcriptional LysR family regulator
MNLHKSLKLFVEVAKQGNMAAAARSLGLSPPSASRLLNDLENWLGQPLVRRTTRHISLTELGERYLPRCLEIVEGTEALKLNALKHSDRPTGRLKVTVSGILARKVVTPVIPQFLSENPGVSLEMDTTDTPIDLMSGKMDLAFRVGHLEDSSLIAKKICEMRLVLVASHEFLARRGAPTDINQLKEFPCLIDSVPRYGSRWPFLNGKMVTGPATISDGEIIRKLTLAGLGISYLPDLFVEDDINDGRLIELFPHLAPETLGIYAVFPPKEYISMAARAFVEAVTNAHGLPGV